MFSQTVEYALRAIVCLAQHDGHPLTARQISALTQVPASYTSKVLQSLAKAKLVNAIRGIGGGYSLCIRPADLSVLQVVNAIDPMKRITTCPLGLGSHGTHLCTLHARLDKVVANIEQSFRKTTIDELLSHPSRNTPLCESQPMPLGRASKPRIAN